MCLFFFTFTDTGLVTRAADPVHHLGLVPDPAPGRFPHLVGVDIPIQAHALDLGVTAALDPGPTLLILMDVGVGKVIEGENWHVSQWSATVQASIRTALCCHLSVFCAFIIDIAIFHLKKNKRIIYIVGV